MAANQGNKHADVNAALNLVLEELGKETDKIFKAGGEALSNGKVSSAKKAIAFAERLKDIHKGVEDLFNVWNKLASEMDSAAPDVKKLISETPRESRSGFSRNVSSVSQKSNFRIAFDNGHVIEDKVAAQALVMFVQYVGEERISKLQILLGGEPFVTRDNSDYKKYPNAVRETDSGWFVCTHCSTDQKIKIVEKILESLKIKARVEKYK